MDSMELCATPTTSIYQEKLFNESQWPTERLSHWVFKKVYVPRNEGIEKTEVRSQGWLAMQCDTSYLLLAGLGYFRVLPDSLILHIFGLLDEAALCACSSVSKAMYVFAEEEELWKPIVIGKHKGDFLFKGVHDNRSHFHLVTSSHFRHLETNCFAGTQSVQTFRVQTSPC
jgi:hypothetical protein